MPHPKLTFLSSLIAGMFLASAAYALPLVVDGDDRIVWVVGQSVAEDFRVTAPKHGVILLKARRLGGVG